MMSHSIWDYVTILGRVLRKSIEHNHGPVFEFGGMLEHNCMIEDKSAKSLSPCGPTHFSYTQLGIVQFYILIFC